MKLGAVVSTGEEAQSNFQSQNTKKTSSWFKVAFISSASRRNLSAEHSPRESNIPLSNWKCLFKVCSQSRLKDILFTS